MKDKKHTLGDFSVYDCSGMEKRLTQMAEKGWLLEKLGAFLWTYHRIEPKKLTFCVCFFPKASAFDPGPSEEQQTFYDFCQHTGWTLAASAAQTQVFYNEAENPTPIETDPIMEVDAVHRSMKRSVLPSHFILLAMALLNGGLFVSRLLRDPVGVLASAASLFAGVCWATLILMTAVEIVSCFSWHRRAVQAAEEGVFLEPKSHRRFRLICLAVVGLGLAYYFWTVFVSGNRMMMTLALLTFGLYLPGVFCLVYGIRALLKRKKAPAGVNRAVTLVASFILAFALIGGITFGALFGSSRGWFADEDEETYQYNGATFTAHHDDLPLTVEDLLEVHYDGYDREQRVEESLLLAQIEMCQRPRFDAEHYREMPRLEYTVTLVKAPFLYDLCKQALLADWEEDWQPEGQKNYTMSIDSAPWGAEDARQMVNQEYGPENRFLLCYKDMFVDIRFDWEPTPKQIALTAEKIGNLSESFEI